MHQLYINMNYDDPSDIGLLHIHTMDVFVCSV